MRDQEKKKCWRIASPFVWSWSLGSEERHKSNGKRIDAFWKHLRINDIIYKNPYFTQRFPFVNLFAAAKRNTQIFNRTDAMWMIALTLFTFVREPSKPVDDWHWYESERLCPCGCALKTNQFGRRKICGTKQFALPGAWIGRNHWLWTCVYTAWTIVNCVRSTNSDVFYVHFERDVCVKSDFLVCIIIKTINLDH